MCGEKEIGLLDIRRRRGRSYPVILMGSLQGEGPRRARRVYDQGRVSVCGHDGPAIGLESVRFQMEGSLV